MEDGRDVDVEVVLGGVWSERKRNVNYYRLNGAKYLNVYIIYKDREIEDQIM